MIFLRAMSEELEPVYKTKGSAYADVKVAQDITIEPGQIAKVPTGLTISHVMDYGATIGNYVPYLKLALRSGFALNSGLIMPNGYGVIDHDYRGEICVLVVSMRSTVLHLKKGDRIAQICEARSYKVGGAQEQGTDRAGGFGSTGLT